MAEDQCKCLNCGEVKEREVLPFNSAEGIALVCEECLRKMSPEKVETMGVAELHKLASGGYFTQENFGYLKAVEGFARYMKYKRGEGEKPFDDTGGLIIANECSSS